MTELIEEETLQLSPEEIKQMSKILAEAFVQQLPQKQETEITVVTYVSGYEIIKEDQITEVINLETIVSATHGITDIIGQIAGWLTDLLNSVASWIVASIQGFLTALVSTISSIINTVISAVSGFISSAVSTIGGLISSAVSSITSTVSGFISSAVSTISSAISGILSAISITISSAISTISNTITNVISTISSTLSSVYSSIMSAIGGAISTISSIVSGILSTILSTISGIASTIISTISSTFSTFASVISGVISNVASAIINTITGFVNTIISTITGIVKTLSDVLSAIGKTILDAIGGIVKTTSDIFGAIAKVIMDGIAGLGKGLTDLWNFLVGAFQDIASKVGAGFQVIGNALTGFINGIIQAGQWIVNAIQQIGKWIWDAMPDWLKGVLTAIYDSFAKVIPAIYDLIVKGFRDFISDPLGWLKKNLVDPFVSGISKLGEWIWNALPDWLRGGLEAIGNFFKAIYDIVLAFFKDPIGALGKIAEGVWGFLTWLGGKIWEGMNWIWNALVTVVKNIVSTIWEAIKAFASWIWASIVEAFKIIGKLLFDSIFKVISAVGEALVKTLSGMVSGLLKIAQTGSEAIGKALTEVASFVFTPIYEAFSKGFIKQTTELAKTFVKSTPAEEEIGYFFKGTGLIVGEVIGAHYLGFGLSQALHAFASFCDELRPISQATLEGAGDGALEPAGVGARLKGLLGFLLSLGWHIKPSYIFHEMAKDVRELSDTFTRGLMYGIAIWSTNPLMRLLNVAFRDVLVIELPPVPVMQEVVRRQMPTKEFTTVLKDYQTILKLYGYRTSIIEWLTSAEIKISVTDRFGTERIIPLSLMYELPSASDVARMAIRDIFGMGKEAIESFLTVYSARGMHPDIGILYYLLHYKYPSPEKLWTFMSRGWSGMLWATIPKEMMDKIEAEANKLSAPSPTPAVNWNFKAKELFTALQTYMTWHDLARFSWIRKEMFGWDANFTSDNQIMIDTLADIPMKIDQRWLCVPPDTIILGDNKPVSEYKIGDEVLYGGRVLETFTRPFNGELIVIKGLGLLPIKVTPEHPILVADGEIRWKYYSRSGRVFATTQKIFTEPYFIEAKKVQLASIRSCGETYVFRRRGHYLVSSRLKGEYDVREIDLSEYFKNYSLVPQHIREKLGIPKPKLVLDEELAWLFGFYVGDGSTSREQVGFYPSSEEHVNKICRIVERYGFKPSVLWRGNAFDVVWSCRALKSFFDQHFGNEAHEKRIPDFILLHKDERILWSFLRGYLDADGNKAYKNPNKYEAVTVSKILALQIQALCFRLGLSCGITKKSFSQARYTDKAYRLTIILNRDEKHARIRFTKDYVFIPVVSVSKEPYNGIVCNLETERNVYLVSNAIVHNCKWGIYEYLSTKGVSFKSPVKDFALKVLEPTPASQIQLDLTNLSRTLQATGLHPDWVPVTALAETMNVLADERTLLRTGFINLFKEGFYNIMSLETLLAGFIKASFQVAYFDIEKMEWTVGWINIPVMFLPPERKLLELKALMDRALDILREIQKDISTAYQEYIIWDYNEYKSRLTNVINNINIFYAQDYKSITGLDLPPELKLQFVEDYYKPYVEALRIWRDVFTIRRVRMWTQRWLGWVMYRVAYGVVEKEDIEKLITYVSDKAKLTPYEIEFISQIMELMYGIAKRNVVAEYLPTPSTLATLSEYITLDVSLVKQVLTERGLDETWQKIWLTYITVKPIKSDAKALLSTYVRAFRYGVVTKAVVDEYVGTLQQYGFTPKEIEFITKSIDLEEQILDARTSKSEYIPTPLTLATICEYLPEARDFYDDVVKAKRIPTEWQELWARYIDIRPLVDDIKRYVSRAEALYVKFMIKKENFMEVLKEASRYLGYTAKELEFLMKVTEFERYRNAWTELIGSVERLVDLSEYSPKASKYALGKLYEMIDALPLTASEKAELKTMWEEYIRNRPVKSEAKTYVTQLINAYVEGILTDLAFKNELQEMAKWGFSDNELMFYEAQAVLRKARKLKIPIGE